MSDVPDDKPVDKDYARARLAEIRRMLVQGQGQGSPDSVPPADPAGAGEVSMSVPEAPFDGTAEDLIAEFERTAERDDNNLEYWSARQLMPLLGYGEYWQNFERVIIKAQIACHQSGQIVGDHFSDVTKMVGIGSGAERNVKDTRVTRYGAYLIAQNGDSRKKQVAFAQTYFAVQTRRQELRDTSSDQVTEEQRRIALRDKIAEHNKDLADAARDAGVVRPVEFAVFHNYGYRGLYAGLDATGIRNVKRLSPKAKILDHMGSTELAANLFRLTQTEEKLRRENIKGKDNANSAHFEVGQKVRKAIQDIGGTMPEKLSPAEDIDQIRKRLLKSEPPKLK